MRDWDYWAVEDGLGWGEINSCRFELQSGSVLLLPPGSNGHIQHSPDHPLKVIACHLDLHGLDPTLRLHRASDLPTQTLQLNWLRLAWQTRDTTTVCSRLHGLIWEMLNCSSAPSLHPSSDIQMERWIEEMKHHPSRLPSISAMARNSHLSPQHFGRLFRKKTGCSPSQYFLRCKIERSQELLAGGRESIDVISQACGWEDPSSFARAFRRATGTSPSSFRKRFQ